MRLGGASAGQADAPDLNERVMPKVLLDAPGRRRSPATMPGFHVDVLGRRYPADPRT
jgi:hypothetical protein